MDIKGIVELQKASVKSSGNSPVKMPSIFGKAMKKYYELQMKRYEKKYAYEQEASKLIYDHYEEAVKQNMGEDTLDVLKQAYNDSNSAMFRYEDKLKKIYSKYDGLNNKVEGFNKAQISRKLAKELAYNNEAQKKPINSTPETTSFPDSTVTTSQQTFDQLVNSDNNLNSDNLEVKNNVEPEVIPNSLPEVENMPKKEDFEMPTSEEPTVEQKSEETPVNQANDKITEFSTYFNGILKENENLLDENANLKKQVEYQADQLNELKQAVEELKKQISKNVTPVEQPKENSFEQPKGVNQTPQVPDFMQYTNRINQSKSIDELTAIENQLRIDKSQFNLTDIQYNVLMSNISNAKRKFELKQIEQPIENSFEVPSTPVVESQPISAPVEPQPVPLNVEPVIPDVPVQSFSKPVENTFTQPSVQSTPVKQYDSNAFITYCNKVSDAVNNHDLAKLTQIQAEIQFNKMLFTEAQFTYLVNNVNNNIQNLNNQNLKTM